MSASITVHQAVQPQATTLERVHRQAAFDPYLSPLIPQPILTALGPPLAQYPLMFKAEEASQTAEVRPCHTTDPDCSIAPTTDPKPSLNMQPSEQQLKDKVAREGFMALGIILGILIVALILGSYLNRHRILPTFWPPSRTARATNKQNVQNSQPADAGQSRIRDADAAHAESYKMRNRADSKNEDKSEGAGIGSSETRVEDSDEIPQGTLTSPGRLSVSDGIVPAPMVRDCAA